MTNRSPGLRTLTTKVKQSLLRRLWKSNSPTAAVVQFAVTGALTVLLLGFVAVTLLRHTGTSEAIRDAKQVTRLAGNGIVTPAITPALERGDPRAIAAMDRLIRGRVLVDPVVRVKIWNAAGRILYSDQHRLIGTGYPLRSDELAAVRSGSADAEVSDLSRPENRFERRYGKLLEVYLGVKTPAGPLLFETYERFSSIYASGRRLWRRFLPALIVAMVLLELAQIPLAWRLAHRVRRGQQEREALLRRAIEASEIERRRIAGELHDSAVQDLAGLSYGLTGAAEQLPPDSPVRSTVTESAAQARMTMRELRSLLVDIYPPTLQRSGLQGSLEVLVRRGNANGTHVRLVVPSDLELPAEVEALIFRTAQEALRNVRSHSGAENAALSVRRARDRAVLEVSDDGRGLDPAAIAQRDNGHFGLRVLGDLARDSGAHLHVHSREGEGARIRLEVPLR